METKARSILIVEDEWKIARFIQMELEHEGYITAIESNGRTALGRIIQEDFDLILLDVMLPEMDGIEISRKVREVSNVPIIMLTARDTVDDIVKGLEIGANDYMTKPFAMKELLARIKSAWRKQAVVEAPPAKSEMQVRDLILYPERFEVTVGGVSIELSKREYELLEYLILNKNIVLKREKIIQEVWGYSYYGDTKVVDVTIHNLRGKLDDKSSETYIQTVRGFGYVVKD